MKKHENSNESKAGKTGFGRQQTVSDEVLGNALRNAIATRVDGTLDLPLLSTAKESATVSARDGRQSSRSTSGYTAGRTSAAAHSPTTPNVHPIALPAEQTPRWDSDQVGRAFSSSRKANPGRRKKIGLSLGAVAGLTAPLFALTRPTLFASKPTDTQIVQVASAEDDRFPVKLIARDPGYKVKYFYSSFFGPGGRTLRGGLHLRNGSVWIDVRPEPTEISGLPTVGVKLVVIGGVPAQLIENKPAGYTTIRWTVDSQAVRGYANLFGADQPDALAALSQIRLLDSKLVFQPGPSKFSAVELEDDPNQYGVNVSGGKNQTDSLNYSVGVAPSYANDYLVDDQIIKRGKRTYFLNSPPEGFMQVSFRFGQAEVSVSGQVTKDRLLAFADTLTEATPDEWAEIVAKKFLNELLASPWGANPASTQGFAPKDELNEIQAHDSPIAKAANFGLHRARFAVEDHSWGIVGFEVANPL